MGYIEHAGTRYPIDDKDATTLAFTVADALVEGRGFLVELSTQGGAVYIPMGLGAVATIVDEADTPSHGGDDALRKMRVAARAGFVELDADDWPDS